MATYDVFLSYNSKDKEVVELLAESLREQGLRCFLDVWGLISGEPFSPKLNEALRRAGP